MAVGHVQALKDATRLHGTSSVATTGPILCTWRRATAGKSGTGVRVVEGIVRRDRTVG
jgi:hypothetical protein